MITYTDSLEGISAVQLQGFFVGWPAAPTSATHLKVLQGSDHVVLAIDADAQRVVGFISAISDGILCAYIPLLEVLPSHQHQGIGRELTRRMLEKLGRFYMVDLICDPELQNFYAGCGMRPASGMLLRNYARQSGS